MTTLETKQKLSFRNKIDASARIFETAKIAPSVVEIWMGKRSFIGDFCFISVPQLYLGEGAQINAHTCVVGRKPVLIGKFSTIGYHCDLFTSSDSTGARFMNDAVDEDRRIIREGPIGIGDACYIGSKSMIMPGVNIVTGVVVRAQSYVNRPLIIPHSIYGGQPCVLLKERGYVKSSNSVH